MASNGAGQAGAWMLTLSFAAVPSFARVARSASTAA
jgi:hypothetical protein